jgi:hypothetical protein
MHVPEVVAPVAAIGDKLSSASDESLWILLDSYKQAIIMVCFENLFNTIEGLISRKTPTEKSLQGSNR